MRAPRRPPRSRAARSVRGGASYRGESVDSNVGLELQKGRRSISRTHWRAYPPTSGERPRGGPGARWAPENSTHPPRRARRRRCLDDQEASHHASSTASALALGPETPTPNSRSSYLPIDHPRTSVPRPGRLIVRPGGRGTAASTSGRRSRAVARTPPSGTSFRRGIRCRS